MPQFGAHNPRQNGNSHHPNGIGVYAGSLEGPVHHKSRHHCGQPQHQTKSGNLGMPEMQIKVDIRKHLFQYRRQGERISL